MTAVSSYPDGNPLPSITVDYKSIFVLRPDAAGRIAFTLTPASNGVLTVQYGKLAGVPIVSIAPTTASGLNVTTSNTGDELYGTIPEQRAFNASQGYGSSAKPALTAFRTVVAVADVSFTGSSMMNGGTVTVSTTSSAMNPVGTRPWTYSTSQVVALPAIDTSTAGNISDAVAMPSTVAFPARQSFTLRTMPRTAEYLPTAQNVYTDADSLPLGYARMAGTTGDFPGPVYSDAPWKTALFSGLDPTASITVAVRHCVQYAVDDTSSMVSLAGASAPLAPAQLAWYTRVANALPTVEGIENTVHNAARLGKLAQTIYRATSVASRVAPLALGM